MIVFLLVLTLYQPDVMFVDGPSKTVEVFASIESAAIHYYKADRSTDRWSSYKAKLYKVNLDNMEIAEVPVPVVEFDYNDKPKK